MVRRLDDSPCEHTFDGGLCTQCLCPDSIQHDQRADQRHRECPGPHGHLACRMV